MPSIFEIVVEITPGHHLPAAHEGTVAMQQNCTPEALSISWRDCMNDRNWLMGIFEDVPWHLRGRKISAPRREGRNAKPPFPTKIQRKVQSCHCFHSSPVRVCPIWSDHSTCGEGKLHHWIEMAMHTIINKSQTIIVFQQ